jgi:catechol 2,3-dioxygenase-like lactoylglutathione lyase family enzyme
MIIRPTHAVIGTPDLDRAAAFLSAFGFEPSARRPVAPDAAQALYGLDGATAEVALSTPGAERGGVRLVRTPHRAADRGPFAPGGHAIDLYARDIDRSAAVAAAAGGRCGPIGRYRMGPLAIDELQATGPDHLVVVTIAVDRRRPSVLDVDASRLHSELHAAVWTTVDIDAVLPFWREQVGLQVLLDVTTDEPAVSRFMELPRPDTRLRLTVLADATGGAPRVEFISFPDDPGAAQPLWPLRAGLHALGVEVDDLEAAMARLPGARWRTAVTLPGGTRAAAGEAPGGVALELRAPS